MTRRIILALAISALVMGTSCKRDGSEVPGYIKATKFSTNSGNIVLPNRREKRVPPADGKYPKLIFSETEHDFGNIDPGDKVQHIFSFKNTGEADLLIESAVGSCGCTVPEFPKEPIKPGQSAEMKVSFNSANKHGQQTKTVTVRSNTESGIEKLTIRASINAVKKAS